MALKRPAPKVATEMERITGRRLQARRLRIWSRNPHCAMCGELTDLGQGTARPFELDHIVALVNGGQDTEDNLQVLCVGCHEDKTRRDLGYAKRAQFDASGRVVW